MTSNDTSETHEANTPHEPKRAKEEKKERSGPLSGELEELQAISSRFDQAIAAHRMDTGNAQNEPLKTSPEPELKTPELKESLEDVTASHEDSSEHTPLSSTSSASTQDFKALPESLVAERRQTPRVPNTHTTQHKANHSQTKTHFKDQGQSQSNSGTYSRDKPSWLKPTFFVHLVSLCLNGLIIASASFFLIVLHFSRDLEDYSKLYNYEPPVISRIYSNDGRLIRELASENRFFVPLSIIPLQVRQAFISAEDKTFYNHSGFDPLGIGKAFITNVIGMGGRLVGASTITQQVAKNFLLTSERTLTRKIKEAILTVRIEKALGKDRILELYLNQIYLGSRSYGVSAAALSYFDKRLDDLTLGETAYLAGVPKAPNRYHPTKNPEGARTRRAYVLRRMLSDNVISKQDYDKALAEPLIAYSNTDAQYVEAEYFAEEIRRSLQKTLGDRLYTGGYSVLTTLDPRLQEAARRALRQGLRDYDRRHGWHGVITTLLPEVQSPDTRPPETRAPEIQPLPSASQNPNGTSDTISETFATAQQHAELIKTWAKGLQELGLPKNTDGWKYAVVLNLEAQGALLGLETDPNTVVNGDPDTGVLGYVSLKSMSWARRRIDHGSLKPQTLGPKLTTPSDILKIGDVVFVSVHGLSDQITESGERLLRLKLEQIPEVQGALVAMEPGTGRIRAMVGGYTYGQSEFNRATQALRQPGSAFKPFVYLSALRETFTPSSLVLDAPMEIQQNIGEPPWRPKNYAGKYYGPTPLRVGLEASRNLMTVRLAKWIGMDKIAATSDDFGLYDNLKPLLSFSLGASETTLLRLAVGYSTLVNGGRSVKPKFVERIQDRFGKAFDADRYSSNFGSLAEQSCADCNEHWSPNLPFPKVIDRRPRVADPISSYQIVHMLMGAVERGTGRHLKSLNLPLAGKTGTTNDNVDAWFFGLSQELVVGAYIGFDQPRPMGKGETGAKAALPVVKSFLEQTLAGKSIQPFVRPPGIRLVQIDAKTGLLPDASRKGSIIWEAFRPGTEPRRGEVIKMLDIDAIVPLSSTDLAILRGDLQPDANGATRSRRSTGTGTGGQY